MSTSNNRGISRFELLAFIVMGTFLLTVIGLASYAAGVKREGTAHETGMAAQYAANQNGLSSYVTSIKEQAGIASIKNEQLDQVLRNAVSGRYADGGASTRNALVVAITEAYPDLRQLDVWDQLITQIQAGRTAFKNKQDALSDRVRRYHAWRSDGILVRPLLVNAYFPSDVLEVRKGDGFVTGEEALRLIRTQVLDGTTTKAFETGKMEPIQFEGPRSGSRDSAAR